MIKKAQQSAFKSIHKLILSLLLVLCPLLSSRAAEKEYVARFHFRLDYAAYEEDYMDNDVVAHSLTRFLGTLNQKDILEVQVTAWCSPEGSYEYNQNLCEIRLSTMRSLIARRFPKLSVKARYAAGGEAWDMIRSRVKADESLKARSPETYRTITGILFDQSISNDTRKLQLKSRLPDNWYGYLRWIHYHEVRLCEVRIRYTDTAAAIEVPVPQRDTVYITKVDTVFVPRVDTVFMAAPVSTKAQPEKKRIRPVLGISTNIPYDITYVPGYGVTSIPSVSLEFYPRRGHFTLGADVEWPMWQHPEEHRYLQVNNITLWTRFYFKPRENRFRGAYLLLNANAARYGLGWDAKGWEGEGLGASLGVGYKFKLGQRMFLDMGLAAGAFYTKYDP